MSVPAANEQVRIGIDVGGTFTDLLLVDDASGAVTVVKTLTTPADPSAAVDVGVREALAAAGTTSARVGSVLHGTTLVTNAIIERKGDSTALITTKGFRDTLEIRREHRYDMYDLFLEPPTPIVPRHLRFEVDERLLADGSVLHELDRREVETLVRAIASRGIKAIAVSLLHAYHNPAHERRIGEIIADRAGIEQIAVRTSREINESSARRRPSATRMSKASHGSRLEIERAAGRRHSSAGAHHASSGGIATVDTSRRFPIRLLESGHAGASGGRPWELLAGAR